MDKRPLQYVWDDECVNGHDGLNWRCVRHGRDIFLAIIGCPARRPRTCIHFLGQELVQWCNRLYIGVAPCTKPHTISHSILFSPTCREREYEPRRKHTPGDRSLPDLLRFQASCRSAPLGVRAAPCTRPRLDLRAQHPSAPPSITSRTLYLVPCTLYLVPCTLYPGAGEPRYKAPPRRAP